ncbi:MAG: hypothetical protein KME64_28060 [Scytonematopsis contorta HA4267-MV1]|jgi:hypothetical protein|nr:hypothetical protein [Scytonematopsis contorta HA4267-MV1]
MHYPLQINFDLSNSGLSVVDNRDNLQFYVKQEFAQHQEAIIIFADTACTRPLYYIKTEQATNSSLRFDFTDENGVSIGAVERNKSLWKPHYYVFDSETINFTIQGNNTWQQLAGSLFTEIPLIGTLRGFVFYPTYLVINANGSVIMRLEREPSFFLRQYTIRVFDKLSEQEETQVLLSLLKMLFVEKSRGF